MRVKKTYVFDVDFEQEEDGFWGVDIPVLGVCAASGHTKEEALEALQELTQAYFEVLMERGAPLPEGIEAYEIVPDSSAPASPKIVEVVTVEI